MRIYATTKIWVKYGEFVVLWLGMSLSYFAQEIQSQRVISLILHKEKYYPEDLQCLYQEKNEIMYAMWKEKRMTGGRLKTVLIQVL